MTFYNYITAFTKMVVIVAKKYHKNAPPITECVQSDYSKDCLFILIICPETGKILFMKKNVILGILAHVDAGKTTLSEAMLYLSGKIKRLGRVDRRDSYLDTHSLERARGITIFSKQAVIELPRSSVTLLDTPGHVDFAAETERSLPVLDYAVLVISGTDGVQAHTETLWRLLRRYNIPSLIFVTKMDMPGCDRAALMDGLCKGLDENCVDFGAESGEVCERLAMCSESAMDEYLETGSVGSDTVAELIRKRRVYPCFFGSGLRTDGVEEFLSALDEYTRPAEAGEELGARVFKIARDAQGKRMSFMRVTGGELRVRQAIKYTGGDGAEHEEKISQLRIYSGMKYETADSVLPGQLCAALGLSETFPGQGLGAEAGGAEPVLEPVLSYSLILPPGEDARTLLPRLMQLQEEDPQLRIRWDERGRVIRVELMGKVQAEIFRSLVRERFDVDVTLDAGQIMYKETIAGTVEGVGHFEPLRHYAEVHLIMEPAPCGSGIVVDSICPEDELDRNWQRLILGHVLEKQHPGVLTGSPLTDVKITLAAGRAHIKHTEGGDFRQATYRAVRQGLMQAQSVLLEPWYAFAIELPPELIGRAISDVRQMSGSFTGPEDAGELLRIEGSAPVSEMNGYAAEMAAYSGGRGRLSCRVEGYKPCHNAQEIIEALGYDAQSDADNSADSVFCAHGGGFNVRWDKVPEYMHIEGCLKKPEEEPAPLRPYRSLSIDERELEAIMEREFGPIKRPEYRAPVMNSAPQTQSAPARRQYIIVDGYNLIFASQELSALARERLDLARGRLMDMLSNYCGFTRRELVLVFDGFRTPGNPGSREEYHNIHVAFTKDGETADAYIERIADNIGKNYAVRVVTNDNLIRLSALRSGVLCTSSDEFALEVEETLEQIDALLRKTNDGAHKHKLELGKSSDGEK